MDESASCRGESPLPRLARDLSFRDELSGYKTSDADLTRLILHLYQHLPSLTSIKALKGPILRSTEERDLGEAEMQSQPLVALSGVQCAAAETRQTLSQNVQLSVSI